DRRGPGRAADRGGHRGRRGLLFLLGPAGAAAGPMTGIARRGGSAAPDGRRVVVDPTLPIPRGARLGLIGPNGSGKTTLLRAIAGLVPHTGELRVGDAAGGTLSRRELARGIALV